MKNSLIKIALTLIAITFPLFAHGAKACVCRPESSPYKAYEEARAVFIGKVVSSKDVAFDQQIRDKTYTAYERRFLFAVEEVFKGAKTIEIEVSVGRVDSDCYAGFTVGETYLVYAYGEELYGSTCTRTNSLAWALDDVHYLRELSRGVSEPRVYGSVSRSDNDLSKSKSGRVTPLEGIKIAVTGAGRRFEAVTDKQGLFSISGVPDGRYKAWPLLPDKYMSYWPGEVEFILGASEPPDFRSQQGASAYARFHVGWNNKIGGRILDAEGNPIKRAWAAVLLPRNESGEPLVIKEDEFDLHDNGGYGFSGLTPGRYLLSLSINAPFKVKNTATRFYFPGTVALSQAGEIIIGEHDSLTDRDIKLPPEYLVRPVEGVVVWPDGSPVADAWVGIYDSERPRDDERAYDVNSADKQGRFSVQGFVGAEYWVQASVSTSSIKSGPGKGLWDKGVQRLTAKPLRITVAKVNTPLRLVIELPEGGNGQK